MASLLLLLVVHVLFASTPNTTTPTSSPTASPTRGYNNILFTGKKSNGNIGTRTNTNDYCTSLCKPAFDCSVGYAFISYQQDSLRDLPTRFGFDGNITITTGEGVFLSDNFENLLSTYSGDILTRVTNGETYFSGTNADGTYSQYNCKDWTQAGCKNGKLEIGGKTTGCRNLKFFLCFAINATAVATFSPTTVSPTTSPSVASPTFSPTLYPTKSPTTSPTLSLPTTSPSLSAPSKSPTHIPSLSPSRNPTAFTFTDSYYQLAFSRVETFAPTTLLLMGFSSEIGERSQNSPVTPVSSVSSNYNFTFLYDGLYYFQYMTSVACNQVIAAQLITSLSRPPATPTYSPTSSYTGFPWLVSTETQSAFTGVRTMNNIISANESWSLRAWSVQTCGGVYMSNYSQDLSFVSFLALGSQNNFYSVVSNGSTAASGTSERYAFVNIWDVNSPHPTSSPTLVTWQSATKARINRNGYYIFTVVSGGGFQCGVTINLPTPSPTTNWVDLLPWSASNSSTRYLSQHADGVSGGQGATIYASYLTTDEIVTTISGTSFSANSNLRIAFKEVSSSNNYHVEVKGSGSYSYTTPNSKRSSIVWLPVFRNHDAGFTAGLFNTIDGRVYFPSTGTWSVNFMTKAVAFPVVTAHTCFSVYLNTVGSTSWQQMGTSKQSGRILGMRCVPPLGTIIPGSTEDKYWATVHVMFPIIASTDFIQVVVEVLEETNITISTNNTLLSVFKWGDFTSIYPTSAPSVSPTISPTKQPTSPTTSPTKLPTKQPTNAPTKTPTKLPTTEDGSSDQPTSPLFDHRRLDRTTPEFVSVGVSLVVLGLVFGAFVFVLL